MAGRTRSPLSLLAVANCMTLTTNPPNCAPRRCTRCQFIQCRRYTSELTRICKIQNQEGAYRLWQLATHKVRRCFFPAPCLFAEQQNCPSHCYSQKFVRIFSDAGSRRRSGSPTCYRKCKCNERPSWYDKEGRRRIEMAIHAMLGPARLWQRRNLQDHIQYQGHSGGR